MEVLFLDWEWYGTRLRGERRRCERYGTDDGCWVRCIERFFFPNCRTAGTARHLKRELGVVSLNPEWREVSWQTRQPASYCLLTTISVMVLIFGSASLSFPLGTPSHGCLAPQDVTRSAARELSGTAGKLDYMWLGLRHRLLCCIRQSDRRLLAWMWPTGSIQRHRPCLPSSVLTNLVPPWSTSGLVQPQREKNGRELL